VGLKAIYENGFRYSECRFHATFGELGHSARKFAPNARIVEIVTSAKGVRREKAALFQWVQIPPGNRSSRK
jgi:hypothetical protein